MDRSQVNVLQEQRVQKWQPCMSFFAQSQLYPTIQKNIAMLAKSQLLSFRLFSPKDTSQKLSCFHDYWVYLFVAALLCLLYFIYLNSI